MSLTTETWRSFFIFKSSLRIEWFHLQHGNSMLSTLDKTSQHVQGSIFLIAHLSDPQASVEKPAAEIPCCLSSSFMLDCVIHVLDWESIFSGFANRSVTAAEDGSAYDTRWASATGWMCSGDSGDSNPLCTLSSQILIFQDNFFIFGIFCSICQSSSAFCCTDIWNGAQGAMV